MALLILRVIVVFLAHLILFHLGAHGGALTYDHGGYAQFVGRAERPGYDRDLSKTRRDNCPGEFKQGVGDNGVEEKRTD